MEFRELVLALANVIDGTFNNDKDNRNVGFVLLAVDVRHPERMPSYVSNMKAPAVLHVLKHQVAIFEEGEAE